MIEDLHHHLSVLGLAPGASREDVKKAHRDLSKVWHPDRFAHDQALQLKAQEQLQVINDAFEHLQTYDPDPGLSEAQPQRPPSGRGMDERVLAPKRRIQPSERLWIIMVAITILVAILLLVSTL